MPLSNKATWFIRANDDGVAEMRVSGFMVEVGYETRTVLSVGGSGCEWEWEWECEWECECEWELSSQSKGRVARRSFK